MVINSTVKGKEKRKSWASGYKDRQTCISTNERTEGRKDGRTEGRKDGRTERKP